MPLKLAQVDVNKSFKSATIISLFVVLANCAAAQKVDSIYYVIPASVKTKMLEVTKEFKRDVSCYAVLSHHNDTTKILISRYGNSPEELVWLIKNSNRFIRVHSSRVIPLLLETDFLFSSLLHSVKNEGQPYAAFKHKLINVSGFLIEYVGRDDKIQIIGADYYRN
jgi:hypothetical protein